MRMRSPRRHRWLTVSVFFIAYSVFQAIYSPSNASEPIDKPAEDLPIGPTNKPEVTAKLGTTIDETPLSSAPNTPPSEKKTEEEEEGPPAGGKKGMKGLEEDDDVDKKDQKDAGYVEDSETEEMREEERSNWKSNPTVKPLRVNCSPPAIEQFPKPLMGQSARKHGGLIIHILVAVFTFIGLAIVCDEYFVSSLDRICEESSPPDTSISEESEGAAFPRALPSAASRSAGSERLPAALVEPFPLPLPRAAVGILGAGASCSMEDGSRPSSNLGRLKTPRSLLWRSAMLTPDNDESDSESDSFLPGARARDLLDGASASPRTREPTWPSLSPPSELTSLAFSSPYFNEIEKNSVKKLKLAPDVAGATFMAAGSSAPELATVVIGVFCAQDDIGVSGVIGSAVFNIMFVISVCALCAGTVSHLNWWPLCRDCFFYAISILVMLCTIANSIVSWPEALFMLIMYAVYCVALRFNTTLERWAMTLPLPFKLPTREEQAALVTYRSAGGQPPAPAAAGDTTYAQMDGQTKETPLQESPTYNPGGAYDNAAYNAEPPPAWDPSQEWDPNRAWDDTMQTPIYNAYQPGQQTQQQQQKQQQQQQQQGTTQSQQDGQQQPQQPAAPAYYKAKEYNPETAVDPLVKPIGANHFQLAWWYLVFPIHWSCRHTMPDCRGRWYPVTFIISMLWISFYSYFMVWMITIIAIVS
ncbi:unnamed protein product [Spodoptera exigua]|nr:unnamed protein product [Spodoptera exigua]